MGFPFGALIGGATSLIGGFLNKKSEQKGISAQNAYNDPAKQRARLEAAGFNPAPFMGSAAAGLQTSVASLGMGNAIANAGAIITDEMARMSELDMKQSQLDLERERFEAAKKEMAQLNEGGIYTRTSSLTRRAPGGVNKTASPNDGQQRQADEIEMSSTGNPLRDATAEPTGERRADGREGSNRDKPIEFESELMYHADEGNAVPYLRDLGAKNLGPVFKDGILDKVINTPPIWELLKPEGANDWENHYHPSYRNPGYPKPTKWSAPN